MLEILPWAHITSGYSPDLLRVNWCPCPFGLALMRVIGFKISKTALVWPV